MGRGRPIGEIPVYPLTPVLYRTEVRLPVCGSTHTSLAPFGALFTPAASKAARNRPVRTNAEPRRTTRGAAFEATERPPSAVLTACPNGSAAVISPVEALIRM